MSERFVCTLLLLVGSGVVLGSAVQATGGVSDGEERWFERVNGWSDPWSPVFGVLMQFGTYVTTPIVAVVVWLTGRRTEALVLLAAGTAAWVGAKLLKARTRRGRPRHALAREIRIRGAAQEGEGYPSGHAAVSAALAVTLGLTLGGWWWLPLLGLAAVTGLARIYIGAHLPLDVLGGAGLGTAIASLAWLIGIVALG